MPTVHQRLIDCIRYGTPVDPDLLRGAEVQAMLDACTKSAATGAWEAPEKL